MKRPLQVTLIGYLFIAVGTIGIFYHASELKEISADRDVILVLFIRVLAILGGVFTLRGANWARWLLLIWIAYHVVLSFYHSTSELIAHVILTIIVVLTLFIPKSNSFFQKK